MEIVITFVGQKSSSSRALQSLISKKSDDLSGFQRGYVLLQHLVISQMSTSSFDDSVASSVMLDDVLQFHPLMLQHLQVPLRFQTSLLQSPKISMTSFNNGLASASQMMYCSCTASAGTFAIPNFVSSVPPINACENCLQRKESLFLLRAKRVTDPFR